MTEFIKTSHRRPEHTIFENAWHQENNGLHIFRSEKHEVMALADLYPKLPLQTIVAPKEGTVGANVHFGHLPRIAKRRLHEVADAVDEKMLTVLEENQRVITDIVSPRPPSVVRHTEGFGVRDHAHILLFVAERKDGARLYDGASLGEDAVRRTVELLRFNEEETAQLNQRLARLAIW